MVMNHRVDFRPSLVDRAVDHPFAVGRPALQIERVAGKVELHQIVGGDQFRCPRSRLYVLPWILTIANADVAKRVHYTFVGQYAVCDNEVLQMAQVHEVPPRTKP